jgi:hypothetical protein
MTMTHEVPTVVALADRQLQAYNAGDIDAFCECYHPEVVVLDADGVETIRGIAAFRPRYAALFRDHVLVHGVITARMVRTPHLVEHEFWRRQKDTNSPIESGDVLVRYTARDGQIATVQFFG